MKLFVLHFFLMTFWHASEAVKILECGKDGHMDIREDQPVTVSCDLERSENTEVKGYNWSVVFANGSHNLIAICSFASCDIKDFNSDFRDVQPASYMPCKITIQKNLRNLAGGSLRCADQWSGGVAECRLNVFYPADITYCQNILNVSGAPHWAVFGSCFVNKMYSSNNSYMYLLRQISPSEMTVINRTFASLNDTTYNGMTLKMGICVISFPLPVSEGTYKYQLSVSPGIQKQFAGTIQIQRPGEPIIVCDPNPVVENADLSCACTTNNSAPGNPPPSLSWLGGRGFSIGSSFRINKIQRDFNGRVLTCQLSWGKNGEVTINKTYTVHVSYGPSSLHIRGPGQFVTNGSSTMQLKCEADSNIPVSYKWTGITCENENSEGQICSFTPSIQDDGKDIMCSAENTNINISVSSNYRLDLNYPPAFPPNISGYTNGALVIEGDTLELSCTIRGGKPAVDNVTFKCDSRSDIRTETTSDGLSHTTSKLTIANVDHKDNGTNCTCTGVWTPNPNWYRTTDTVALFVGTVAQTPAQNSLSHAATGCILGGAAAAVVAIIITIVVVVKLRKRRTRAKDVNQEIQRQEDNDEEEFEEHTNVLYNMDDGANAFERPTTQAKPTAVAWRVTPKSKLAEKSEHDASSDVNIVEESIDVGYFPVSPGHPQHQFASASRNEASHDEDLGANAYALGDDPYYSIPDGNALRASFIPPPGIDDGNYAAVSKKETKNAAVQPQRDTYAVVDKTKKKQCRPDQKAASKQINSAREAETTDDPGNVQVPSGDVYALVSKNPKRSNAGAAGTDTAPNMNRPAVKPKPDAKPKLAVKTKPSTTTNDAMHVNRVQSSNTSDAAHKYEDSGLLAAHPSSRQLGVTQTTETDDEYNTLRFGQPRIPTRQDAGSEYSHISST